MANTSKVTPKTPGETPPEKQMPPQDLLPPGETPPEEQSLVDQFEALPPELKEYVKQKEAMAVKEARRAMQQPKVEASGLPDQKDVDPDKIKRAVLTKDGYVCPNPPPEEPGRRMR